MVSFTGQRLSSPHNGQEPLSPGYPSKQAPSTNLINQTWCQDTGGRVWVGCKYCFTPGKLSHSSPLGKATIHLWSPYFLQNQADGDIFSSPGCASTTSVTHIYDLHLQNWKSSLGKADRLLLGPQQTSPAGSSADMCLEAPSLPRPVPHGREIIPGTKGGKGPDSGACHWPPQGTLCRADGPGGVNLSISPRQLFLHAVLGKEASPVSEFSR